MTSTMAELMVLCRLVTMADSGDSGGASSSGKDSEERDTLSWSAGAEWAGERARERGSEGAARVVRGVWRDMSKRRQREDVWQVAARAWEGGMRQCGRDLQAFVL